MTQARLKELLEYYPYTGLFIRVKGWGCAQGRSIAGTNKGDGYIRIFVDGRGYAAHRLAWLYMFGSFPAGKLDHRDGNRQNNAIANLREASRSLNMQNQWRARSDSALGILGVHRRRDNGLFRAEITLNGKKRRIGQFATAKAASAAYAAAKRRLHADAL